jgi:hypothetical protein
MRSQLSGAILAEMQTVQVVAIGVKDRNRLMIGGEEH